MTLAKDALMALKDGARLLQTATPGDELLGPLAQLPGIWTNDDGLEGRGWNMIAVPFASPPNNYRLLLNQYDETLAFTLVDKGVPNRGIDAQGKDADQSVVALDYQQVTRQIATDDFPHSGKLGPVLPNPGSTIHHEPGLWLNMLDQIHDGLDIARLGTIPHGDSLTALGSSKVIKGAPVIPDINGLPFKVQPLSSAQVDAALEAPYLEPYKHFHDHPFRELFDPTRPAELLREANTGVEIVRTTVLDVDTATATGGIRNIPFIVDHADATAMRSIFWLQELAETDANGNPKLRLQYLQIVMLDFAGLKWPHISINTMHKAGDVPSSTNDLLLRA